MTAKEDSVRFAGLTFRGLNLKSILPHGEPLKLIVTVNADFILTAHTSKRFASIVSLNCATFDGQITWWLAKLLARPRDVAFEKLSGASLTHDLLQYARKNNLSVFFLGAAPEVNRDAVVAARERYGVLVSGYAPPNSSYPFPESLNATILDRITKERPGLLFVALGSPKQEFWLDDHRAALQNAGVVLAIGCGGSLDFLAGRIPRAPSWAQAAGLESLFRLAVQPRFFRLRRILRSLLAVPIACWASVRDALVSAGKKNSRNEG